MASKFEACVARIAALGNITHDEARKLLQDVDGLADAKRKAGEADPTMAAAFDLAGRFKQAAKDSRLDALRNAAKRSEILERIDTEGGIANADKTLRAIMHWMPGAKHLDSVEGLWHVTAKTGQAVVGNKLRQAGVEDVARSGAVDKDVAKFMWDINANPGSKAPGDSPAAIIANTLKTALDIARDRMNGAGAHIGTAMDYVTHTNWDPRQLRLAAGKGANDDQAFAAWWKADGPRMAEKTFEHLTPQEGETLEEAKLRFARSIYEATVSGVHMRYQRAGGFEDDGAGYIPPAYEGTRNIAEGVSQQRVVFWKDAQSWLEHMQEFGGGKSIYHQTMESLASSARNLALMEKLGTNPRGNFNTIVRRVQEKYRPVDLDGVKQFQNKINGLERVMDRLDGTANIPVNEDWARRFEYLFTLEAMSHLGGVGVTHAAAAPFSVPSELSLHGVSHLEGLGHTLTAVLKGRGPEEMRDALAEAGAYAEGYNLFLHSGYKPGGGVPGVASWLTANFMRLTGLPEILGRFQANGIKSVLMTKLGQAADAELSKMEPWQQTLLRRYGIGDEEWDALRSGQGLTMEGRRYLLPRNAEEATEESIKKILDRKGIGPGKGIEGITLDRAIQKERWLLGDKLLMYLNDAAEHATITPGVRERAVAYGESKPGSLGWLFRRSIAQFKMWPFAAMNQVIGREIGYTLATKGSWKAAAPTMGADIGAIVALSAAGGAVRMMVNDAASGKPQRNYLEGRTLLAALAQGGGLGIFGDFMFGETNRMGAGIVSTLAGPVISDVDRLVRIFQRWREDSVTHPDKALQHMFPDAAHFAVGHIPFANLIYLKGALDYMLWYHLYEAASPGWWERTNRRLQKETGRTMSGYVPGQGVPWNPLVGVTGSRPQFQPGLIHGAATPSPFETMPQQQQPTQLAERPRRKVELESDENGNVAFAKVHYTDGVVRRFALHRNPDTGRFESLTATG